MKNTLFGDNTNVNAPVVATIKVKEISPDPDQPRKYFDEKALKELAVTIKEKGLIQPIIVRSNQQEGGYIIIAGERRWRAVQLNKSETIEAIVRDDLNPRASALIENIQRQNLKPVEEAQAIDSLIKDENLSQGDVGTMLGIGRTSVNQILKICKLPPKLQEESIALDTSKSIMLELVRIDDEKLVNKLWSKSKKEALSVAEIRKIRDAVKNKSKSKKADDEEPELSAQEKAIRKAFDALETLKNKPLSEAERARLMELQAKISAMLE